MGTQERTKVLVTVHHLNLESTMMFGDYRDLGFPSYPQLLLGRFGTFAKDKRDNLALAR